MTGWAVGRLAGMLTPARTTRGGVLAAAVLSLGACGGVHPGEAVVVGPDSVTLQQVDDLGVSYCKLTTVINAQQGAAQAVSGGEARRQAAQALVGNLVANRVAKARGVSVPQSKYSLNADQQAQVAKLFKGKDVARVTDVLQMSQQTSLLLAAIGADQLGVTVDATNTEQAQQAGQRLVQQQIVKDKPSVDPRLGLDLTGKQPATTSGSLSVGVSALSKARAGDYAAAQRCS